MTLSLEIGGRLLAAVGIVSFVFLVKIFWQIRTGRRPL